MGKSKRHHKSFPDEDKDKKVKAQREVIKGLEREVKRLKQELRTLNEAFKKSAEFMSDESRKLTTEELIKAANNHQTLKQAKKEYEDKKESSPEEEREKVRKKWAKWNEERKKPDSD